MDKKKVEVIIGALDKLGLALTGHNHQWTNEERRLYERAIGILTKPSLVGCYATGAGEIRGGLRG